MKKIETLIIVAGLGLLAIRCVKIGWSTVVYELRTVWIALPVLVAFSEAPAADAILGVVLREEGVATRFGELV